MNVRRSCLVMFLLFCTIAKSNEAGVVACAVGYGTTLALDVFSTASAKIRHGIYGNVTLPEDIEKQLRTMIADLNMGEQPTTIKQSYWLWDAIAGNVFSNHDTLYVSKKLCDELSQGLHDKSEVMKTLDFSGKKELMTSLLMMVNQYDNKLLLVSAVVPLSVWLGAKCVRSVSKKVNFVMPLNYVTYTIKKISKNFDKSFKAKALTSLCIIGAYILHQRYCFDVQAQELIKSLYAKTLK